MKQKSWTKEQLKEAAANSKSIRHVILSLGLIPAGGNYKQIQKFLDIYKISTKHFTGKAWNRGMTGIGKPRIELTEILKQDSDYQSFKLKKRLFNAGLKKPRCELCGWAKKSSDGRLPLELDHINGDNHDNRLQNLQILCPNCHSLQPTHRGRNRKK